MKKFALIVLFLLFFTPVKRVNAQACEDGGIGTCYTSLERTACPEGQRSDPYRTCPGGSPRGGITAFCCVNEDTPPPSCSSVGGTCLTSCGSLISRGQRDCSTGEQCCAASVESGSNSGAAAQVCDFAGGNEACVSCFTAGNAWTAIGCIPTDPTGFISLLLGFGMGIAGGIAFLLILLGGFQILTSAGNPEQLNEGRELVSSAITGLLLIIFSVFILKVVGVDILRIPGFS